VDVDVEDKEDVLVAAVVMLVKQHQIVIKERQIQMVMNRIKVEEMEIGVAAQHGRGFGRGAYSPHC
jgi:hypothetical protein